MLVIQNLEKFKSGKGKPLFLALGNFDGLHMGHQRLIRDLVGEARRADGQSAVLTFQKHPQRVLHETEKPHLLTSTMQKLWLLREMGLDLCFVLPFTKSFSMLDPHDFVKEILVEQLGIAEICLGHNAKFGFGRKGDAALMKKLAKRYGFHFREMKEVQKSGEVVSSSQIRELVESGKLQKAEACLGRPFEIFGQVMKGMGRGHSLGYPTANLEMVGEVLPPCGVYPVFLRVVGLQEMNHQEDCEIWDLHQIPTGPWLKGVLNHGLRPTFREDPASAVLEVYVMDFSGDLKGKYLEVVFYPRIREEIAFRDAEELKAKIGRDIEEARKILSEPKNAFTNMFN